MPVHFNEAWAELPEETVEAALILDCRVVFNDGQCNFSCLNCGLKRHLIESYPLDE